MNNTNLTTEVWKPVNVEGFSEKYEVSNFGNIRNIKTLKILKPLSDGGAYQQVILCNKEMKKSIKIHRVVALTFIPNPENKSDVNHINGNKEDNNLENLEWTTRQENMQHYYNYLNPPKTNHRNKAIAMYKKSGEYITTYDSLNHLLVEFPVSRKMVLQVLYGRLKHYKNFIFEYVETD